MEVETASPLIGSPVQETDAGADSVFFVDRYRRAARITTVCPSDTGNSVSVPVVLSRSPQAGHLKDDLSVTMQKTFFQNSG